MYYLRTRPAAQAIQFTVDQSLLKEAKKQNALAGTARAAASVTTAESYSYPRTKRWHSPYPSAIAHKFSRHPIFGSNSSN
jgi:ribonucleoside-diphosphate reductase subunit M1